MGDPIEKLRGCWLFNPVSGLKPFEYEIGDVLADEIEAAYMKLPVDADGVPIRVGDEIEYPNGRRDVVRFITINDNLPTFNECGWIASKCRHVKPDTVESLLEEFAVKYEQVNNAPLPKVGFGNEIIGEEELSDVITEYAERIRKAVEHD